MPPKPGLNSIIICDATIVDLETRKRSLIGIFQNIRSMKFPCTHPILNLYASVTDAVGEYVFSMRLIEQNTDTEVWKASLPPMTMTDPLEVKEISVRIMNISFPSPGRYEFQFFANDELLDLRRITLELVQAPPMLQSDGPPDEA